MTNFPKVIASEASNLLGLPRDCFVAKLLAMTDYRNKFLTSAIIDHLPVLLTESEGQPPTVVTNDPQLSESTFCLACHDAAFDVTGINLPYVLNGGQDLAVGSFTPSTFSDEVPKRI